MSPKNYFIIPSTHYPPNAIFLGSILTSPTSPTSSINRSEIPSPRTHHVTAIFNHTDPADAKIRQHHTRKHGIEAPWAHEIGVNLGVHFDSTRAKDSGDWHFEKLEKQLIVPDEKYVERAMAQKGVKKWMSGNEGKGMWMVTGIQIARGARRDGVKKTGHEQRDSGISMGEGGVSAPAPSSVDIGDGTDFVYAYRVNEIGYHKRRFTMKGLQNVRTSMSSSRRQSRELGSTAERKIDDTFLLPDQEGDVGAEQLRRIKEAIASDAIEGDDGQYEVVWV